ncbi:MAG: iron ABC transporter permease [Ectothiorhodospiraceae bacterium]|nr:iron ABC transporter permease [Ectothiorhodospiraceae bacterium]
MSLDMRSVGTANGVVLALLGVAVVLVPLAALGQGAVEIPLRDVVDVLRQAVGGGSGIDPFHYAVLTEIRLPRVILALIAGAILGLAGAMMQTLFRNPLADPGLIGSSAGAALAAAVGMILGAALFPGAAGTLGVWFVPLLAFAGAMVSMLLVLRLASHGGHADASHLLLAGIAVNALAGAGIGMLVYVATDDQLRNFTIWTLGSLAGAGWPQVIVAVCVLFVLLASVPFLLRPLNALLLGEGDAACLGFNVTYLKTVLLVLSAAGVGVVVAFCGVIGFVGLVVPNVCRLLVGPNHGALLPASALMGAALLTGADLTARTVVAPTELPIGILTALIGAPFFILLLRNRVRRLAYA